ncbi:MAG: response regulator [Marinilabiliales bacterium]|nr:response regulator [Marinilabiliales bacterium]
MDDIASNLIYLKIILKGIDANLIEAESGYEALEKIKGLDLSLAILDVQMAGMNGYELAIRINENRTSNSVPIIFLTAAFPNSDQILIGYESGAVDYIIKPLNRKVLISKVNIFLQLYLQKQVIVESREELLRSEIEIQKHKDQLELLNHHLINAREDERAAIALMIHDEMGQALTALKIDLGLIRQHISGNEAMEKMEKMVQTTNEIIRKVQRISSELHPKLLTDLGLSEATEWYCSEQADRTGLQFVMDLDNMMNVDFNRDLAMFRILQEAVTNIIRHAHASIVHITLQSSETETYMEICDNGIGFDPEIARNSTSLGLFGMIERARQCKGTLTFENNHPSGTIIRVSLPHKNQ